MKKLAYVLIFVFAAGVSLLMLPYFRNADSPAQRFVYANAADSFVSADLTGLSGYTETDAEGRVINYEVLNQAMVPLTSGSSSAYVTTVVSNGVITGYRLNLNPSKNFILAEHLDFYGKTLTVSGFGADKIINGNGYGIGRAVFQRAFVEKNEGTIKHLTIFATCSVTGGSFAITNEGTLLGVENYAAVRPFTLYNAKSEIIDMQAGGLVFENNGLVSDSTNYADVKGHGGISLLNSGTIIRCGNQGVVSGAFGAAGGITGINNGTIEDCVNYAHVDGKAPSAGGIAGISYGKITDVQNRGMITGSSAAGGIAGSFNGLIDKAVNFGLVKAVAGAAGGIAGKTEEGTDGETAAISGCQNFAVVIGAGAAKGILGKGAAAISDTENYGRLNGKTELTVQLDEILAQYKIFIVGIAGAAVLAGIISIIADRYNTVKNRRREIETILSYAA
ncbi:MAG: hypothetical protein LBP62_02450 [Clostridiales bacterium]|jgi:hypothetical protein|nr:hypothetical protein [Clostridiales bacterium]